MARPLPEPLTVLAVSSDEARHAPVRALLKAFPAPVSAHHAPTAEAAVQALRDVRPDAILVDRRLDPPGTDGLQLAEELVRRETLGYPPFGSLIRIVCGAESAADARAIAAELCAAVGAPGASILGPAPLFRLRGKARSQLVIKAGDRAPAIRAVGAAVEEISKEARRRGVSISVDVDPQ